LMRPGAAPLWVAWLVTSAASRKNPSAMYP
jgi:hypothetical protein